MAVVLHPNTDFDQIVVTHPSGYQVILVKQGDTVHAWRNRCPHVGVNLDWGDGRCKTGDNELTCMMHGAIFAADTGLCLAGPCAGDSLVPVAITIVDGAIVDGVVADTTQEPS
jgi:nitrite reductase/ring-hydroxylating ferredoxin subunit